MHGSIRCNGVTIRTEWQLLWTLGLVKPNNNDDMVRTKPAKYTTLQPISIVADGSRGRESFSGSMKSMSTNSQFTFRIRYFVNSDYFYTVSSRWRWN